MLRQNVVIGIVPACDWVRIAHCIEKRYGIRVGARTGAGGAVELVAPEIRKLQTLERVREYLAGRVDAALEAVAVGGAKRG